MADAPKVAVKRTTTKKLLVRFGRGRLGGTTYLDALAQRALQGGRSVILVDADVRNPSLSKLYPGARVPAGGAAEDFGRLMTGVLDELAEADGPVSALVDIGGGQDRAMADFIRDLNLVRFCKRIGVLPVAVYMLGPDEDDLTHALSVRDTGIFDNDNAILVMNEALVKRGQTPRTAFGPIIAHGEYEGWVKQGARPVWMRNLGCLERARDLGLSLTDAAAGVPGEGGKRLGPTERFQIEDWMDGLVEEHRAAEALELLP